MIAVALKLLTSRLAGPVAAGVAAILAVMLVAANVGKSRVEHSRDQALQARDNALRDLGTCQSNTASLKAAMQAQNAAIQAVADEGAARLKAATEALQKAEKGRAGAMTRAARLMRPPAGIDACARMESADAAVLREISR